MEKKTEENEEDLVLIFCPPLRYFIEQLQDQSKCELIDCPTCHEKMWFSEKKKNILVIAKKNNMKFILECYECFEETFLGNPGLLKSENVVDI